MWGTLQESQMDKENGGVVMGREIEEGISKLEKRFNLRDDELAIVVAPSVQELYVVMNRQIIRSYPVSTAKAGSGCEAGSEKTPFGSHRIKEKIGDGARPGTIFIGRQDTRKVATIYTDEIDIPEDFVTTRIMWLDGEEEGINRGKGCDTHQRYIYIHGTPEEGLIGKPVSHGCIRLKNKDVIELFDLVPPGTPVEILPQNYHPQ
jgi:hypothetical protein